MKNRLDKIYKDSLRLNIDDESKIIIMSDIHRGDGKISDNFLHNENIFLTALRNYYLKGFTYIELGDGDDWWEVKNYLDTIKEHLSVFKLLKKFHEDKRFVMVFGNHDMCKKRRWIVKKYFSAYDDEITGQKYKLLENLKVYEAVVLSYKSHELFLLHGHQVDLLNSTFWKLSRFLVRNVWRRLENLGVKDPTSAAKNYQNTERFHKKLDTWSREKNKIVISGHTHKPTYPKVGNSLYFNDGAGIHPNGITGIEIEKGKISLVKWSYKPKGNLISVQREVIAGGVKIKSFFK